MRLTAADCEAKLHRTQGWMHPNTLGVYVGIEYEQSATSDYEALFSRYHGRADYLLIKCYEADSPGKGNDLWIAPDVLAGIANKHGVGVAPYIYGHPDTWQQDAAQAVALARVFGGVVLDCEEPYLNNGTDLYRLVHTVREATPDSIIVVSGYGDPISAFPDGRGGTSWSFDAIADADCYQPQWYIGWWDAYRRTASYRHAVSWGDEQCALAFNQRGLTTDFPIQPAMNVEGVNPNDIGPCSLWLRETWKLSCAVWEHHDITDGDLTALVSAKPQA